MDERTEYRRHLVLAEQKAYEAFDKTIILLSGGAMGVSLAFVDKIAGHDALHRPAFLLVAWLFWAASMTSTLASHYFSAMALRRALTQVDRGTIDTERPGGSYAIAVFICNAMGGILFVFGLLFIIAFASLNLGG